VRRPAGRAGGLQPAAAKRARAVGYASKPAVTRRRFRDGNNSSLQRARAVATARPGRPESDPAMPRRSGRQRPGQDRHRRRRSGPAGVGQHACAAAPVAAREPWACSALAKRQSRRGRHCCRRGRPLPCRVGWGWLGLAVHCSASDFAAQPKQAMQQLTIL
jgi:hypothetical protein